MKNPINLDYDVIIVGGGPAGLSASLYIKRAGLKVLIIEKQAFGGKINNTDEVENYLVGETLKGYELAERFTKQIDNMKIEKKFTEIISINKEKDYFEVYLKNNTKLYSRVVIVATGTNERKLDVPNSDKYQYRGITYCGVCDGPGYKDKNMMVIGGGYAAIEEGLFLSALAKKLILVHRRKEFRANNEIVNKLKSKKNVEFILDSIVETVDGDKDIKSAMVKNVKTGKAKKIDIDVIFPYIGQIPLTSFLVNFGVLDENGYVIVDKKYQTKVEGLFAAGDVVQKDLRQIATAVSDGCIAAQNSIKYIQEKF